MESTLSHFNRLLSNRFSSLPDTRSGKNSFITMKDIGLSAFSVFFTQSSSFLEHQRLMESKQGQNNAKSLFSIAHIPTDNHIRSMLDEVPPSELFPLFGDALTYLGEQNIPETFNYINGDHLLALDGLQYYSSKKISCDRCSHKQSKKEGSITYSHSMVSATLVHPEHRHVLPLIPSFIEPQDGREKQDCEREAVKRWMLTVGPQYAKLGVALLGDDLYCCEPLCKLALATGFHFIFNCKPESHTTLYEWIDSLEKSGGIHRVEKIIGTLKGKQRWKCRYVNQVPIKDGKAVLPVNWCELEVLNQDGERLYFNTFATDYEITDANVVALVKAGRTRWKTENEHNNNLKNAGYHLEHNYGHGKKYLSQTLATLILLSFLLHTLLNLLDQAYIALRRYFPRAQFFQQLRTLLMYLYFATWETLMALMSEGAKPMPRRQKRKGSG